MPQTRVLLNAKTDYFEDKRLQLASKLENEILTFSHHNKKMQGGTILFINLIKKKLIRVLRLPLMQTYHSSQRGWSCVCIEVRRPTDSFLLDHLTGGLGLRHRVTNRCRGTRRHHVICWIWSVTSSSGSRRRMWSDLGGMKRGRPSRQRHA